MSAAATYAARIDAVVHQQKRLRREDKGGDRWSGAMARRFRADPHRPLDANLSVIASYLQPDDVLIDVGGGAGRLSLPLALRCKEVVNVDPSPGMDAEFKSVVAEAGIGNARMITSDWLAAEGVQGDVVLAANVTYFVREIVPFVRKLQAAARRLVMIPIASPPPPMQNAKLYELVHGEPQEMVPGQPELLPVLWELGITPDVRLLPEPFVRLGDPLTTREQTIEVAVQAVESRDPERARQVIAANFDQLFAAGTEGFKPLWQRGFAQLLILWRPDGKPVQ